MASPYKNRSPRHFWRPGAESQHDYGKEVYRRRFEIRPQDRIATAGSCFAQRIAEELPAKGFSVIDVEPPPIGVTPALARRFGYRTYSARYGNIYTARQLLQLTREALGIWQPADWIWERNGRYFDALRPGVEPHGLSSADVVRQQRTDHLARVKQLLKMTDVFIFTLGLTEAWADVPSGTIYPTAPETIAGTFDKNIHTLRNFSFEETVGDFIEFRALLRSVSPDVRILLTVSPVPLMATATEDHVLPATIYSKSVLRAAAGALRDQFDDIDYFPSYELVGTPFTGNIWFEDDRRSVSPDGVQMIMKHFFSAHGSHQRSAEITQETEADKQQELVCEEVLLGAFA